MFATFRLFLSMTRSLRSFAGRVAALWQRLYPIGALGYEVLLQLVGGAMAGELVKAGHVAGLALRRIRQVEPLSRLRLFRCGVGGWSC